MLFTPSETLAAFASTRVSPPLKGAGMASVAPPTTLTVLPARELVILAFTVPLLIWTRPGAPVVGPKELTASALIVPPFIVVLPV